MKYVDKAHHEHMYRVLIGQETEASPVPEEVMNYVQDHLQSSYFLAVNPLPQLRKIFPQLTWRFENSKDLERIREIVYESDLIWCVNTADLKFRDFIEADLVTATLGSRRVRSRWFYAGKREVGEETTDMIDFVKLCGGEPIFYNYV